MVFKYQLLNKNKIFDTIKSLIKEIFTMIHFMKSVFFIFALVAPIGNSGHSNQSSDTKQTVVPSSLLSSVWADLWLINPKKGKTEESQTEPEDEFNEDLISYETAFIELERYLKKTDIRHIDDTPITIHYTCTINKQQWPAKVEKDENCQIAKWNSSTLSPNATYLIMHWIERWSAIPRINQYLLKNAVWSRNEKRVDNGWVVNIDATIHIEKNQIQKWRAGLIAKIIHPIVEHQNSYATN